MPLVARDRLVDTLLLARRKHPGGSTGLDDLCARYGIDNSHRTKHGALLDAELAGGSLSRADRQAAGAARAQRDAAGAHARRPTSRAGQRAEPLANRLSDAEREEHKAFVAQLGDKTLWASYSES